MSTEQNAYDAVEYPAYSYPHTHPDQLAVMASLHGLAPAPLETCRVLEIGCSEGANLIPLACALPGAAFTGFDLAGLPVARGQERIRGLGLSNIRLFQADLLELGSELAEYDYIIAHGLYAWVPEPVRDRLLALCGKHLAPNGIAFVSYNALPGSHIRKIIRDLMLWAGKLAETPEEQVAAGMGLLNLLVESRPEGDSFRRLLEEQLNKLRLRVPGTTFHDELSPAYAPASVAQFVEHARRHGLEYLCESVLPVPNDPCLQPKVMETIAEIAGDDVIAEEQLLDFIRMRMYRETLLVRTGQAVERKLAVEPLRRMRFASTAQPAAGDAEGTRSYTLEGGVKVNCQQAPVIAVVERLIAAWPKTLSYAQVLSTLTENGLVEAQAGPLLQQMAMARLIDFHLHEPLVAGTLSERPRAPAAIRQEAGLRQHVANLWHGTVKLGDPVVRALLQLLDGTRNRAELLAHLRQQFPAMAPGELERGLEANLKHCLQAALLEA